MSVSTKHTLALTNRGGATTAELLDLAAEIRAGVQATFDIRSARRRIYSNCSILNYPDYRPYAPVLTG